MSDYTDFSQFVRLLTEARAAFIIVDGVAGTVHGAAPTTYDLDFDAIAELEVLLEEQQGLKSERPGTN